MTKAIAALSFSLLLFSWPSDDLSADGLIMALPADGTRVSYSVQVTSDNPPPEGFKMSLTISSVGKAEHEGEPCRWIEIGFLSSVGEMRRDRFHKLLIPEAELKAGSSPLEHVIKAYHRRGDGAASVDEDYASPSNGPLPVLLAGPIKGAKKLDATTVNTGLGKLKCVGTKGEFVLQEQSDAGDDGEDNSFKLSVDVESRLHKKVPFGVAKFVLAFSTEPGNGSVKQTGVLTFTADKISTGAKTALPDAK